MMWIKIINKNPASNHGILSTAVYTGGSVNVESFLICIFENNGGNMRFGVHIYSKATERWYWVSINADAIPTSWTHFSGIFNPSVEVNLRLKMYIDGSQTGDSHTIDATYVANTYNELVVGRLYVNKHEDGDGDAVIDELLIFETALSPGEIQQIYSGYEV